MQKFKAIDSLRGIAALSVAYYHLSYSVYNSFGNMRFVRNSWLYVDFFFVLSGFILTHVYVSNLVNMKSFAKYMIHRFGRLYPLHIFVIVLLIFTQFLKFILITNTGLKFHSLPFSGHYALHYLPNNLFLLQGILDGYNYNLPSWSISCEFYVAIIFGLLLLFFKSRAKVITLSCGLIAISITLLLFRLNYLGIHNFLRCGYGFFIGVVTYLIYMKRKIKVKRASLLELSLIIMWVLYLSEANTQFQYLLAPILSAFLIYLFAHEKGLFSNVLQSRYFCYLGSLSYSIYMMSYFVWSVLIHWGFLVIGKIVNENLFIDGGSVLYFYNHFTMDLISLASIALLILVSIITYRYIESPFRRYFRRKATALDRSGDQEKALAYNE